MTTEVTRYDIGSLPEQMEFAKAVSTGDLLPQAYRNKPANVMIAVGLGASMGLSPMEALYRIDVIQGKPTASAELIASNVRKAGHTLRLEVNQEPPAARCVIVRADDPDFEHVVVRNEAWAKQMGLAGKDNYKKQPATMLGWRALTACARQACPEALYGVQYTQDEARDIPAEKATQTRVSVADFVASEPEPVNVTDAEVAADEQTLPADGENA